ncbi:MAG TPA: class I SAM-dependent methyltransferase [Gemmatimonadaceae bacterium]|nr:class I SAM-dependent methyltransferase [Gemmatimonadaceae bacterium]
MRTLAWDCATGNGQAAVSLGERFDRVIATDASDSQIRNAVAADNVEYRVATAYDSGIEPASVDLITVAQAIHWFDLTRFYQEANRVLRPDGVIAVWGYGDPLVDDPELNAIVHRYNRGTIESYWHPERHIVLAGYSGIEFPFLELESPSLQLECHWSLSELAGYMRTWSATASFAAQNGYDPVIDVESALARTWGQPESTRTVTWPLALRVGKRP